ncbi:MAG: acylphosphatase [Bacteroidales bacterium]|nr:acylphosphatase [Bacteroidales bacterium]
MKMSYRITVYGKVQNVGFRFYTARTAQEFNIEGFVRNEPDGAVYIEAEGEEDALDTFAAWCRRGPQWARVDQFDIQKQPLMNHKGFRVR